MIAASIDLIVTGSSLMPSTHDAFARRRAQLAGELREVVGRVQAVDRRLPAVAVDEVVPVGNQVAERAALMAERDAAVHAARALLLAARRSGTADRPRASRWRRSSTGPRRVLLALDFDEACRLTHATSPCRATPDATLASCLRTSPPRRAPTHVATASRRRLGLARFACSASARLYSRGITLTIRRCSAGPVRQQPLGVAAAGERRRAS